MTKKTNALSIPEKKERRTPQVNGKNKIHSEHLRLSLDGSLHILSQSRFPLKLNYTVAFDLLKLCVSFSAGLSPDNWEERIWAMLHKDSSEKARKKGGEEERNRLRLVREKT